MLIDSEYPVLDIHRKMQRLRHMPYWCILVTLVGFALGCYGLATGKDIPTWLGAAFFFGSIFALVWWAIWEERMNAQMLETSDDEQLEVDSGLESAHLH